jgi:transketolase
LISRGGYILLESDGDPELVLIATGSEVNLALLSARELIADGLRVRVVSMPCIEIFDMQSAEYRSQVLPDSSARRLAIEAGIKDSWWRYVDGKGDVIGMDTFGHSAPAKLLFEHYGFTVEAIVSRARQLLLV